MSKGIYNSSATRIRPFFGRLSRLDETGGSWLAKLLTAADRSAVWPNESLCSPGRITNIVFETERAGEQAVGPPEAFWAWLLRNPDQMVWPKGKSGDFSPETQTFR
jgi:hypothetical protein